MIASNLLRFFPKDYEPSTGQIEVIKEVNKHFSNNKKFCIVSAPTGTGKSFLSQTLSNASNSPSQEFVELVNSYKAFKQDPTGNYVYGVECESEPPFGTYTLTITKNLQDQYKGLFADINTLKGKTNYICAVDNQSLVDTAPCLLSQKLKEDCFSKNKCPYYTARNTALVSRHAVLNYKMFLHLPKHIKHKNYIICDEASELESELVKMFSINIDVKRIRSAGINITQPKTLYYTDVKTWLYNLSIEISLFIDKLTKNYTKNPNLVLGEKNKILFLKNIYFQINTCLTEWNTCEWIIDEPEKNIINITPLKVNSLTKNIFDFGEQIVLMSATIIDHKKFAQSLGIQDYGYVEVGGNFNKNLSPIYISNANCLNYNNKLKVIPNIAKQILEICETFNDKKGIIHTHSMEITNLLKKYLKHKRFLFRDEIKTNDDLLNVHCSSAEPTVLVSPSLTHGVDLKDDLARFCIIVKLPFLPLGNKRIKKLFQHDKDWYENQMLNTLVQMCGRATRSKNDFSNTYILDGNAFRILPRTQHKLPEHFFSRIN